MKKTRQVSLATALLALITMAGCMTGCGKRIGGGPVTPYETVMTWNDGLAQTNNVIAKGLIDVSPTLVSPDKAAAILRHQRNVADIDAKLTAILKQGQSFAVTNSDQVKSLTVQLSNEAEALVNDGSIGVKNPKSKNTFDGDIANVSSLVNQIIGGLKIAGVIQ